MTIAFLGLGSMGQPMARRLVDHGHDLVVWNRTPARCDPLAAAGARVAATPADAAADADVVVTMLAGPDALATVSAGEQGFARTVRPGSVVIEASTVGPAAVQRLAAELPAGVELIDAPVLGSIPQVREGALRIFVGGEPATIERVRPILSVLGTTIPVGPLGSGAAAKLVANSTLLGVLGLLGEALALGDGLGLDEASVFEVLTTTPLAPQADRRRAAVEGDRYPLHFRLELAVKDGDLVVDAADRAGVDLRLAPAARSWFEDSRDDGWGALDYSSILAHIRRRPRPDATEAP